MPTSNYHNEKPLFHNTKSSHAGLTLYLDFSKKDILKGLFYTSESDSPWLESLASMAKSLEGKSFSDLCKEDFYKISTESDSFFYLPGLLLKEALDQYRGKSPALYRLKKQAEEDLICRCFGVYKEELLNVLEEHPEYKNKDLTNATMAGAGCTTCLNDFSEILAEAKSRQAQKLLQN